MYSCPKAYNLLQTDQDIKRRWIQAVHWLREQLEVNLISFFWKKTINLFLSILATE